MVSQATQSSQVESDDMQVSDDEMCITEINSPAVSPPQRAHERRFQGSEYPYNYEGSMTGLDSMNIDGQSPEQMTNLVKLQPNYQRYIPTNQAEGIKQFYQSPVPAQQLEHLLPSQREASACQPGQQPRGDNPVDLADISRGLPGFRTILQCGDSTVYGGNEPTKHSGTTASDRKPVLFDFFYDNEVKERSVLGQTAVDVPTSDYISSEYVGTLSPSTLQVQKTRGETIQYQQEAPSSLFHPSSLLNVKHSHASQEQQQAVLRNSNSINLPPGSSAIRSTTSATTIDNIYKAGYSDSISGNDTDREVKPATTTNSGARTSLLDASAVFELINEKIAPTADSTASDFAWSGMDGVLNANSPTRRFIEILGDLPPSITTRQRQKREKD